MSAAPELSRKNPMAVFKSLDQWWMSGWITSLVLAHLITSTACNTIGSVSPSEGAHQIKTSLLALALNQPASCDGYISRLNFCYHTRPLGGFGNSGGVYSAIVQIWRELEPESQELHLVHEYNLRQNTSQDAPNEFVCRIRALSPGDYITVKKNDVIGVILPQLFMSPLQLISTGVAGFGLYSRPLASNQITKLQMSTLTPHTNYVLHLYANIETNNRSTSSVSPSPSSSIAHRPSATSMAITELTSVPSIQTYSSAMSSTVISTPSSILTEHTSVQSLNSRTSSSTLPSSSPIEHTSVQSLSTGISSSTPPTLSPIEHITVQSLSSTSSRSLPNSPSSSSQIEPTSVQPFTTSTSLPYSSSMSSILHVSINRHTSVQLTPSQSKAVRTRSIRNQLSSKVSSTARASDSHSVTPSPSIATSASLSRVGGSISSAPIHPTSTNEHIVIQASTMAPYSTDISIPTETPDATDSTSSPTQPPTEESFMSTIIAGIVAFVLFVATLAGCILIGCVILVHYRRRVYLVASTGERSEVDAMSLKDISPSSSLGKTSNNGIIVSNIHGHFIGELKTTLGNRPVILPINLETDSLGVSRSTSISCSDGRGSGNTVIVVPPKNNSGSGTISSADDVPPPPPVLSTKGQDDGSNSSQNYMQMASTSLLQSSTTQTNRTAEIDNGASAHPRIIVQNADTHTTPIVATVTEQPRPACYNDYDEPRRRPKNASMYQNGFLVANRRSARDGKNRHPQPMRSRASTVTGGQVSRAVLTSRTKDYEVPISNLTHGPLKRALSATTSNSLHQPMTLHKSKSTRSAMHRKHGYQSPVGYQNGTMVKTSTAGSKSRLHTRKIGSLGNRLSKSAGNSLSELSTEEVDSESSNTMDGPYRKPPTEEHEILGLLNEVNAKHIALKSIKIPPRELFGQFGYQIVRTSWRKTQDQTLDVCLKATYTDEGADRADRIKMLQEAAVLAQFRHPNVVRLHGVIYKENVVMLVIEQFPKEDLKSFLEQMGRSIIPPDTAKLLLSFSQQVALGMQYLASKGFVHKDLAARNVFVTSNDVCKVGELWKSEELSTIQESDILDKVFVKWTAPEAMYHRRYSVISDIWSYGCLLYEIWSLGRAPFKYFTNKEVIEKVDSGYRLPPPPGCPRCIYSLMIKCWNPRPLSRPPFKEILNVLLQDENRTLQIPVKDAATHDAAILLGSQLEASKYMYTDLQRTYITASNVTLSGASNDVADMSQPKGILSPRKRSNYDHISGQNFLAAFPTSSADIECVYKSKKSSVNGATTPQSQIILPLSPSSSGSSPSPTTRTMDLALAVPSHQRVLLEDTLDSDYEEIIDTR